MSVDTLEFEEPDEDMDIRVEIFDRNEDDDSKIASATVAPSHAGRSKA